MARFSFPDLCFTAVSVVFLASCATNAPVGSDPVRKPASEAVSTNEPVTPVREPAPEVPGIRLESVEFYHDEVRKAPPIVPLGSKNSLTLRFDLIDANPRQFIIKARAINPDWTPSPLQPFDYMKGVPEDQLNTQRDNGIGLPQYQSYVYRFPNDNFTITKSGAYVLELLDIETRSIVREFPFFLAESELAGTLHFEDFVGSGESRRVMVQPFFTIPSARLSQFPCQETYVQFVQDRDFAGAENKGICDQSRITEVRFHLPRERAFIGNFEYRFLDLSTYRAQNARVLAINDTEDPPQVKLAVDNPEFTGPMAPDYFPLEGVQRLGSEARYTTTEFRLINGNLLASTDEVYLVGNFNRWTLNEADKMNFDPSSSEFKVKKLLKEGRYQYSYMIKRGNGFQFVSTPFTTASHEYLALVYVREPAIGNYRLVGFQSARK
jgi:hypothetical protein